MSSKTNGLTLPSRAERPTDPYLHVLCSILDDSKLALFNTQVLADTIYQSPHMMLYIEALVGAEEFKPKYTGTRPPSANFITGKDVKKAIECARLIYNVKHNDGKEISINAACRHLRSMEHPYFVPLGKNQRLIEIEDTKGTKKPKKARGEKLDPTIEARSKEVYKGKKILLAAVETIKAAYGESHPELLQIEVTEALWFNAIQVLDYISLVWHAQKYAELAAFFEGTDVAENVWDRVKYSPRLDQIKQAAGIRLPTVTGRFQILAY